MTFTNIKVRFTSIDQYGSLRFISTPRICPKTYEQMVKCAGIISSHYKDSYSPIFKFGDKQIVSIRMNRTSYRFQPDEVYSLSFKCVERSKQKDEESKYIILKITSPPKHIKNENESEIDLFGLLKECAKQVAAE